MDFVLDLRQAFPAAMPEQQEYESFEFNWGEPSLKPVRKMTIVMMPVAKAVTFETLVAELKAGTICDGKSVNVSLLKKDIALKLSK